VYVFGRAVGLAEVWLGMYEGTSVKCKASGGVVSNSDSSITGFPFSAGWIQREVISHCEVLHSRSG